MNSEQQEDPEDRFHSLNLLLEAIHNETDQESEIATDQQSGSLHRDNEPDQENPNLENRLQSLLEEFHISSDQDEHQKPSDPNPSPGKTSAPESIISHKYSEFDLAKGQKKLVAQRKSLRLRFRAERAELQLERMKLEYLRKDSESSESSTTDANQNKQANDQSIVEPVQPDGESENTTLLKARLRASEEKNLALLSEIDELQNEIIDLQSQSHSTDFDPAFHEGLISLTSQLEQTQSKLEAALLEADGFRNLTTSIAQDSNTLEDHRKNLWENVVGGAQSPSDATSRSVDSLQESKEIIRQKDQLIAELQKANKEAADRVMSEASSIAEQKTAEMFDQDEIIIQERKRLQHLETQWREQIGEAEIKISKERAKLARDKTALDEQLHEIKTQLAKLEKLPNPPRTGKWLDQLGLS